MAKTIGMIDVAALGRERRRLTAGGNNDVLPAGERSLRQVPGNPLILTLAQRYRLSHLALDEAATGQTLGNPRPIDASCHRVTSR